MVITVRVYRIAVYLVLHEVWRQHEDTGERVSGLVGGPRP